jgi:anhydro-N-acetylmuramic acid kinase
MVRESPSPTALELLGQATFPYPASVRKTVLAAMNSPRAGVADLARLNFLLGEFYADAVLAAQQRLGLKAELVGCHGQTIYHQGTPARFLGRQLAVTWQTGEGAILAARLEVPVVTDFRPADMAAGGKGAPLVPYLDYLLYRDSAIGRIALNLGGIANLTAIPPAASADQILAFDTGPGNMVIDALAEQLLGVQFDRDGGIAATGCVLEDVVSRSLRAKFFRQTPPKTAGREEFGREFAKAFLEACRKLRGAKTMNQPPATSRHQTQAWKSSVIATATALTTHSISDAIRRYVLPRGQFSELVVSGGGARNSTLLAALTEEAEVMGLRLRSSDEFGIPSEAKEAVAFAVLAFETWNRRPSNVPAATGARRHAVLGKVSYP